MTDSVSFPLPVFHCARIEIAFKKNVKINFKKGKSGGAKARLLYLEGAKCGHGEREPGGWGGVEKGG